MKDNISLKLIAAQGKAQMQAQHGEIEVTAEKDFTICASAVNYPSTVGQNPPNMNGLVDRSTSFVNALMILDDLPQFRTQQNTSVYQPENYSKRNVA